MSVISVTGYLLVLLKVKIKIQVLHAVVSLGSETFGQGIGVPTWPGVKRTSEK